MLHPKRSATRPLLAPSVSFLSFLILAKPFPGNDGLTVELYKAFWHVLGEFIVDSLLTLAIVANCPILIRKLSSL